MVKFELPKGKKPTPGLTISQNDKSLSISSGKAAAGSAGNLTLTNPYGNSISFALDDNGFDQLWSALWEFIKDRQH